MPVILREKDHAKWLGEAEDGDFKALLRPFSSRPDADLAISPRVNSPENNDPGIIDPIPGNIGDWKLAGP
jgi:putative SOS response-associated peptidase YedK